MHSTVDSLLIEIVTGREYRLEAKGFFTTAMVVVAITLAGIALGIAYLTWA